MRTNKLTTRQRLRRSLAKVADWLPSFRGKIKCLRVLDRILGEPHLPDVKTIAGVSFSLQTTDLIDFNLFYLGCNELKVGKWLERRIKDGHCVLWDVGANVGSISLPLLQSCPNLIAYCFEPSPANVLRLETNVSLNPHLQERVTVVAQALSNRSGETEFFVSAEPHNSGVGSLRNMPNTVDTAVNVKVSAGDDLIESGEIPAPDFIKIDVEGFEYEVLQGLERYLRKATDLALIFEHVPDRLRVRKCSENGVFDLLHHLGYSTHLLNEHSPRVRDYVAIKIAS
jgi:FkbM family methyltransferase